MSTKEKSITVWKLPMVPDQKEIEKQNAPLLKTANSFSIITQDHFNASAILVQNLDAAIRRVEETFDPFVEGLHKLHKMAIALRNNFSKPLYYAKDRLLAGRRDFRQEQERLKYEAERKLAAGLQKEQQKDLEKQAKLAEKQGELQLASALREQKEAVPLPVISSEPAVPKQEGFAIRKRWIYTIVDPNAVERQFCSPDPKKIRPVVEALGPNAAISGIKIEEDVSEYSRRVNE